MSIKTDVVVVNEYLVKSDIGVCLGTGNNRLDFEDGLPRIWGSASCF